jgi:hypothetical protein
MLLNQTFMTTSRVLTDMAAATASERQAAESRKDDAQDGYTDRGDPVVVPHELPPIYRP